MGHERVVEAMRTKMYGVMDAMSQDHACSRGYVTTALAGSGGYEHGHVLKSMRHKQKWDTGM